MKTNRIIAIIMVAMMGLMTVVHAFEEGKVKFTEIRSANSPLITF